MWDSNSNSTRQFPPSQIAPQREQYVLFPESQTHTLGYIRHHLQPTNGSSDRDFKSVKLVNNATKKVKFDQVSIMGLSKTVLDPRLDISKTEKALSRSSARPATKVYPVKWVYDKYSIGEKPSPEIVVWNLQPTSTVTILKNHFSPYGGVLDVKIIEDPQTAVPLGMAVISFNGEPHIAHSSALKATAATNRKLSIQGRVIRCGVNTGNVIYKDVYDKTMDARSQRLIKQKEEQLEKERQKQIAIQNKQQNELIKLAQSQPNIQPIKALAHPAQMIPVGMNLSAHDRHILPYSTCTLPKGFDQEIKNKPFIFVASHHVPPQKVAVGEVRSWLGRSKVLRILTNESGFYMIFNHVDDAQICFDTLDGRKVYSMRGEEFKMYMTLYIPNYWMRRCRIGHLVDTIFPTIFANPKLAKGPAAFTKKNEISNSNAQNSPAISLKPAGKQEVKPMDKQTSAESIRKELGNYLTNDIYEIKINSIIKSVLESDDIQQKRKEWEYLKKKESEERKVKIEQEKIENGGSVKPNGIATVVKSLDVSLLIGAKKPSAIRKHKKAPVIKEEVQINERKRKLSIADYEDEDEDENGKEFEGKKERQTKDRVHVLGEEKSSTTDNSESETPTTTAEPEIKPVESESIVAQSETGALLPEIDIFAPTHGAPIPVFDDSDMVDFKPTLSWLKTSIKSEEDFNIVKKLLKDEPKTEIKDIDYWGWKCMDAHKTYSNLIDSSHVDDQEDGEKYDFEKELQLIPSLRNATGSFKTEPYKKIPDSEKFNYLIHRRRLTQLNPISEEQDEENTNLTSHAAVQSSRVNRANDRRFAADVNMIAGGNLELNKLSKRKKPVQFARSAIHNWGLYALENISAGEMIIEYVGERIRQQVAELREKKYLRSGIGSSYLFRVDESTVIDASKKGGIARFINHCCEPSCTAKIIKVDGSKRIVIYALRDVKRNEELTYDYKFERETNDSERITCLCGAKGCKGFLN